MNKNEGSALITALFILVMIFIIAVTLNLSSIINIKLTSNIKKYINNFLLADSANKIEIESITIPYSSKTNTILDEGIVNKPFKYQKKIVYLYSSVLSRPGYSLTKNSKEFHCKVITTVGGVSVETHINIIRFSSE